VSVQGSPALAADGSILVPLYGDTRGSVVALNPADGSIRWSSRAGSYTKSSPIVDGEGWIYFAGTDNSLYALDPAGRTQWSLPLGAAMSGAALAGGGIVYVTTADGKLHAVGAATP